ncbi:MAG: hypothetical protein ACE5KE_02425 [Methanosarcinales archaeon]
MPKTMEEILLEEQQRQIEQGILDTFSRNLHEEDYLAQFTKEKKSFGEEILETFLKLFDKCSTKNEIYAHQMFHCILGQMFKDITVSWIGTNENDLRFNPFVIISSGAGKSVAVNFLKKISDGVNVPFYVKTGEITEAALIGSFTKDPGKKPVKETGLMEKFADGGIIHFDEADCFLSSQEKEYNKNLLSYIQTALNTIGSPQNRINKDLKYGSIDYFPKCSFSFTTYPIKTKMMDVLKRGFFQRIMPYCKILTKKEWDELVERIIDMMYERHKKMEDEKWKKILAREAVQIDKLISKLLEVKSYVEKNFKGKRIVWEDGVKEKLNEINKKISRRLFLIGGDVGELFDTFRVRTINEIHRVAIHKAFLDKRLIISVEDIEYAESLMLKVFNSLLGTVINLEEVVKHDSIDMQRWRKLKRDWSTIMRRLTFKKGLVETNQFVEVCAKYFDVHESTMRRYLTEWVKKGLLKRIGGGRGGSFLRL